MFYLDTQRTVTRRDSSVVLQKKYYRDDRSDVEALSTTRGQSTARLTSESGTSLPARPRGSIQKELITMLFDSMLDAIVESWEVIGLPKTNEIYQNIEKAPSNVTLSSKKKKPAVKASKSKRSRSKMEILDTAQTDSIQQSWFSTPDEKAVIRFRNGNKYEGNISMKVMNGEGRFQWADGTVYLGQFKDNTINGKGTIQWKDDTWYEGDFVNNIRHGRGLYVNSRKQTSYAGEWDCGTKHGIGVIYYSKSFRNSYDGEWLRNVRHGFGSREYCPLSGYKGEWDEFIREGKGLMIWPNHDFYRGEWKNGVMSGYGYYIWDAYYNNTMSLPSISAYRGYWYKGERNGYGNLNLGFGLGSCYKGEFKNNKKHGVGKLVTNNGLVLHDKNLFIDDNLGPTALDVRDNLNPREYKQPYSIEPYQFDICDSTVGLVFHIQEAIKNIDREADIRNSIVTDFIENNRGSLASNPIPKIDLQSPLNLEDLMNFEESSLRKSLRCYETDLKNIYYQYATICNIERINFTPILIRLYLWQLYYDCNIHEKGLTLVQIDRLFYQNPEWLAKFPHDPFEKIYFWQFIHGLVSVASKLYAKRQLPGKKPDTIVASALRMFMERDVLPGAGRQKGRLTNGYGSFVPLNGLYKLYRSLGEPCTIRSFMCAVRRSPHCADFYKLLHVEEQEDPPEGRNLYVFGDEMIYITDGELPKEIKSKAPPHLKLFNFGNLSSKIIIKVFSLIFPQIFSHDKIMDLNIEITFFEFFEAFIACAEESVRMKDDKY
ncbi:uncharacterized protein [Epargyreus clarus]|uniref:uncharacterized protein n=1 Tax=Epargyreus clarus TaxID=520877 RepID=UPI003C2D07C2